MQNCCGNRTLNKVFQNQTLLSQKWQVGGLCGKKKIGGALHNTFTIEI